MFESIKDEILKADRIVFVTGAGISLDSGIPTYRGKEGLWKNYDPMKLATIEAFYENPKLVWEWYADRRKNIFAAQPNLAHKAIAEMEKFADVSVLTQNIDGLHQRAGSSNVYELHGSIVRIKCTVCNYNEEVFTEYDNFPPKCQCGSMLRPDVVWFGEQLPQKTWQDAMILSGSCDLMVIVGTSLSVSPANTLPVFAGQNEATLIEINPDSTLLSSEVNLSIREKSSEALPKLLSFLSRNSKV
ncbi:MAG: NAD-dependent deacylase [Nitrosopumilaceae archaeon]|nr:NAD-dependent deacylase [Nitrosopumilaceae archaeon]